MNDDLKYKFTVNPHVYENTGVTANELDKATAKAELTLNDLNPELEIGSMLKGPIGWVFSEGGPLKTRPSLLKLFLVALFEVIKAKSTASTKVKLLLIRNSNKYHFQSLINPIHERFRADSDLIVHSDKSFNSVRQKRLYYPANIAQVFRSLYISWNSSKKAHKVLIDMGFGIPESEIRFELFKSLMSYYYALELCEKRGYRMVLVDTDRGNLLATSFCLAASKLGVKSVTLQHGAIDTVDGYYPVIADEIWCWGDFQKRLLLEAGLKNSRVRNIGNPVAQKGSFKGGMTNVIGFGLSGGHVIDIEKRIIFWLLEQSELKNFDIMIKIRPSQEVFPWMLSDPRLKIYETEERTDANNDFFTQIDLLIVTISSIGPEAVASGVPLWVYKISSVDLKLDELFVRTSFFPNISDSIELERESTNLKLKGLKYLEELWSTQSNFIMKDYYCAVGNMAVENICEGIQQEIRDSN
ncbi:hypothetical protein [Roseivirga sp.]|uniref:hypothetical protein n=1 Tax=Roseivirga sp. TaxID=1964215 RepID=UPI002B26D9AB|nr:hypothetical protein [Roseivirga sp.]